MIFGNSRARLRLAKAMQSCHQTILLSGPAHVGKFTFLDEIRSSMHPEDVYVCGSSVNDSREAVLHGMSDPILSDYRTILIPDIDSASEPAQDAFLKLCEEPPSCLRIIASSSDPESISPALMSRFRVDIKFEALGDDDMVEFAKTLGVIDNQSLKISCGLPGMYGRIAHRKQYAELRDLMISIATGKTNPILVDAPTIITKSDPKLCDRLAISHISRVVSRMSMDNHVELALLRFARTVYHSPSANIELHWYRMASSVKV